MTWRGVGRVVELMALAEQRPVPEKEIWSSRAQATLFYTTSATKSRVLDWMLTGLHPDLM